MRAAVHALRVRGTSLSVHSECSKAAVSSRRAEVIEKTFLPRGLENRNDIFRPGKAGLVPRNHDCRRCGPRHVSADMRERESEGIPRHACRRRLAHQASEKRGRDIFEWLVSQSRCISGENLALFPGNKIT